MEKSFPIGTKITGIAKHSLGIWIQACNQCVHKRATAASYFSQDFTALEILTFKDLCQLFNLFPCAVHNKHAQVQPIAGVAPSEHTHTIQPHLFCVYVKVSAHFHFIAIPSQVSRTQDTIIMEENGSRSQEMEIWGVFPS